MIGPRNKATQHGNCLCPDQWPSATTAATVTDVADDRQQNRNGHYLVDRTTQRQQGK